MLYRPFHYFIKIYHKILELFFDFDIGVYAFKTSKIPVKEIQNFQYTKPVRIKQQKIPRFDINVINFEKPDMLTYTVPSLISLLVLRNLNDEFYKTVRLKSEMLEFLCLSKDYDVNLKKNIQIKEESFVLDVKSHKSLENEIQISRKLRTIEELLELEPYVKKFDRKEIINIPVTKYPIKSEKFTEKQIEIMKTQLAIEAKCKKYSMTLENIYDKMPMGLYSDITINKDTTITCKYENNPTIGENQILVTGKRKYDTQITKRLIKYSELGL